jgi:WbqC-like protein family
MSSGGERGHLTVAIHQPEFLPWLGFIDKLRQCDVFVFLDCVQFEKNYFQNRNRIRTAVGSAWLTVPVLTKGRSTQTIDEVTIRAEDSWRRKHHGPALEDLYAAAGRSLADFNIAVIGWLAGVFGLERRFVRASALGVKGKRSELLLAICQALDATEYLSGVSGRDYLDESRFRAASIAVRYQDFHHPEYRQCYAPFVSHMSAVDLVFNVGDGALDVIASANPHAPTGRRA